MVYLKLQPYRQRFLATRINEKLAPRFYSLYKVLQKIGKVAYKLELRDSTLIHPTFHVSQLKAAVGSATVSSIPPHLTADFEMVAQPADILYICCCSSSPEHTEVLVLWQDLPETDATWEDLKRMLMVFPSHHLEDKVKLLALGNVMHPIPQEGILTYKRRKKRGAQVVGNSVEES